MLHAALATDSSQILFSLEKIPSPQVTSLEGKDREIFESINFLVYESDIKLIIGASLEITDKVLIT